MIIISYITEALWTNLSSPRASAGELHPGLWPNSELLAAQAFPTDLQAGDMETCEDFTIKTIIKPYRKHYKAVWKHYKTI